MSDKPLEESSNWVKSATGLYLPPSSAAEHVGRAVFAVKVQGFAPDPDAWDGKPVYELTRAYGPAANETALRKRGTIAQSGVRQEAGDTSLKSEQ